MLVSSINNWAKPYRPAEWILIPTLTLSHKHEERKGIKKGKCMRHRMPSMTQRWREETPAKSIVAVHHYIRMCQDI